MHSSTLLSIFAIFAISISLALAAPSPVLSIEKAETPDATTPQPAASTTPPVGSAGKGNAASGACSAAVMALAQGIQSNIDDQNNEIATVSALGNVLVQSPMDMTLYAATQTSLLGFVTKGIAIRENNQKIAPQGNAALPGLAVVAMAQMTELNLTMSLAVPASGAVDQKTANATVEALKGDFTGGVKKNKENLMMVCLLSLPFPPLSLSFFGDKCSWNLF
jgi:hypothetical protein